MTSFWPWKRERLSAAVSRFPSSQRPREVQDLKTGSWARAAARPGGHCYVSRLQVSGLKAPEGPWTEGRLTTVPVTPRLAHSHLHRRLRGTCWGPSAGQWGGGPGAGSNSTTYWVIRGTSLLVSPAEGVVPVLQGWHNIGFNRSCTLSLHHDAQNRKSSL